MTRAALAAVFLLGAGATAAHADPRLDAFRSACIPYRADYEAIWLRAKQDGWVEVAADDDPELAAAVNDLRMKSDPPGLAILSPFRKEIEGRALHLVVASFPRELSLVTSCLLFDFAAAEPIDADLVGTWLNAAPDEVLDVPGEISGEIWWDTEALPDATVTSGFFPEGSPASFFSRYSEIILQIETVGQ